MKKLVFVLCAFLFLFAACDDKKVTDKCDTDGVGESADGVVEADTVADEDTVTGEGTAVSEDTTTLPEDVTPSK